MITRDLGAGYATVPPSFKKRKRTKRRKNGKDNVQPINRIKTSGLQSVAREDNKY